MLTISLLLVSLFPSEIAAEQPVAPPHLVVILPPEATPGVERRWEVVGQGLDEVNAAEVDGEGVVATVVSHTGSDRAVVAVQTARETTPGFRRVRLRSGRGLSNALVVRVDPLQGVPEHEPNDQLAQAMPVSIPGVVTGRLLPLDADAFRFEAKAGTHLTLDLESRRLGVPITPLLSVSTASGQALRQAGSTRGVAGDVRLMFDVPADEAYVVQIRDTLLRGDPAAVYRLRITTEPFATACFPLGGHGRTEVQLEGGNFPAPLRQAVDLRGDPGSTVPLGPFRLAVGEAGRESFEPVKRTELPVLAEAVVNGRLSAPGEVDRYQFSFRKGEPLRIRVDAGALGSWLDPVVTVRDAGGARVAESDDHPLLQENPEDPASVDVRLDLDPNLDGNYQVDVADRYRTGGPEYGYRLQLGPADPELRATLPTEEEGAESQTGVFDLAPGDERAIRVRVASYGRVNLVTLRTEGLPPGVTATAAPVRLSPTGATGISLGVGTLRFRAATAAEPGTRELRITASTRLPSGKVIRSRVTADVPYDGVRFPPPARAVTWRADRFLVVVTGSPPR